MRVQAETPHRLRLARDPLAPHLVQAVGLDQGEGDVAIQPLVVREVDALLAALTEEAPHGVATGDEARGVLDGGGGRGAGAGSTLSGARPSIPSAVRSKAAASSLAASSSNVARARSATSVQSPASEAVSAWSRNVSMRRWMRSLGMWGDDNANTQGTLGPASTTSRPARSLRLFHGPQSRRLAAWRRCKQLGEHGARLGRRPGSWVLQFALERV